MHRKSFQQIFLLLWICTHYLFYYSNNYPIRILKISRKKFSLFYLSFIAYADTNYSHRIVIYLSFKREEKKNWNKLNDICPIICTLRMSVSICVRTSVSVLYLCLIKNFHLYTCWCILWRLCKFTPFSIGFKFIFYFHVAITHKL